VLSEFLQNIAEIPGFLGRMRRTCLLLRWCTQIRWRAKFFKRTSRILRYQRSFGKGCTEPGDCAVSPGLFSRLSPTHPPGGRLPTFSPPTLKFVDGLGAISW